MGFLNLAHLKDVQRKILCIIQMVMREKPGYHLCNSVEMQGPVSFSCASYEIKKVRHLQIRMLKGMCWERSTPLLCVQGEFPLERLELGRMYSIYKLSCMECFFQFSGDATEFCLSSSSWQTRHSWNSMKLKDEMLIIMSETVPYLCTYEST